MVFPGDMIINIASKELSYVRLLEGFTSKGERNAGVKYYYYWSEMLLLQESDH